MVRASYSLLLLACFLYLSLIGAADPLWDYLQQARPELARQRMHSFSRLQQAQLAYARGETGQAWRLIRELEKSYQPGQQPPEFFWVRGNLLRKEQWELAEKNFRGLLELRCSREQRLGALSLLAQGAAEQHQEAQSRQWWSEAAAQAALLNQAQVAALVRFNLIQANLQLLANRPDEALSGLLATRALASRSQLPALTCLADLKLAETDIELADWQAFPTHCLQALEQARACPEPWLVEKICTFWVEQQLARRSEPRAVGHCVNSLEEAQRWFRGEARLAVTRQLARACSQGLNQRTRGLSLLDSALGQTSNPRLKARILSERLSLIGAADRLARRQALLDLDRALRRLGPLEPEDPITLGFPRYGGVAALADTYLPDDPSTAARLFAEAEAGADTPGRRLEMVNYELTRYTAANAMPLARKTLSRLLAMLKEAPFDQDSSRLVRRQMFALRSEASQFKRLLLLDDIRPAPESPATIVLTQLLHEQFLQSRLERSIYERIRLAQNYRDACEAYQARAELLMAQARWGEAILALERVQQSAQEGGWPLRRAQALRMSADAYWTLGRSKQALDSELAAERLYASSSNARDQRSAQDCRLLRAYFLLRSQRVEEALQICHENPGSWFSFLEGRCWLALNQPARAEKAFLSAHFEEELAEIGRLVFLARCSDHPESYYQQAYERAQRTASLAVREVCLDWAAWLRSQHQEERAAQLEKETATQVTALLEEYPPEVRDRLYDEPHTQLLLKSERSISSSNTTREDSPRESRRIFLAGLNDVRERYPELDATLAVPPGDLAALQEQMPAGRVLVQYFAADTDLYAMRVDSRRCSLVQVAVEKAVLQGWVEEIRTALSKGREIPELPARRLYAVLVGALGTDLEDKQIQVVPNGFFWYLPWDVLKDWQGRYLVESQEWSCVSPAELLRLGLRGSALAGLDRVVALGGTTADLPATVQEARQVASLFPHGLALVGPEARASELQRLAPQAQVLHLATHSGLSPELNQTYIQLSDGRFSLEQVYGLQLEPGSRVVLSSCESSLGQVAPGREVSSLASAFLSSGASSVLATLWKVDDQASLAFFSHFYPHLRESGSVSRALRLTRLDCLADPQWKAPSNWGAYQLIGDPG